MKVSQPLWPIENWPPRFQNIEQQLMHNILDRIAKNEITEKEIHFLNQFLFQYDLLVKKITKEDGFESSQTLASRVLYDPHQILKSSQLHPELKKRAESLLQQAWKSGLKVFLFEGFRSFDRQNELYQKGGVTNARGGQSYHNYGLAVDIIFYDEKGRPSWNQKHNWQKLGEIGKNLGLTWGGDFKSIKDLTHFEYHPQMSLKDIQKLYQKGGKDLVWARINRYQI